MSKIARWWGGIQGTLFGVVETALGEALTPPQRQLVAVLEVVRIEEHVAVERARCGRPRHDRRPLARALVGKAVYGDPTTAAFVARLRGDRPLCLLCGFAGPGGVPSEATFSRAFAEFAAGELADRAHEALVATHLGEVLVGHVARDSTAISARERPAKKPAPAPVVKRRPGRPRKGEVVAKPAVSRLPRQLTQTAAEALAELPRACDWGGRKDSHGRVQYWRGYKLHLDVCDAGLPLLAVTTSASLHDSQAAIPMARCTAQRVTALYEVMDSAYAAAEIAQACRELDHVPIIDVHGSKRRQGEALDPATARRYGERTVVERAYSRLKDSFGARFVRVRGHAKVHLHLMFGVLALFADQLLQLAT